ncbi:unnamed protein product [Arabis nemorensis]|uniref:CTLH domain-containing protein n=1 Tax=Arabis nemorensis TaxID=586526 RepID=A0A565ANI3_9BRAS|nr:unnamed protein product [Arabis nemorensis]
MAEEQVEKNEEDMVIHSSSPTATSMESSKTIFTSEVWDMNFKAVNIRKEDMNRLVMNFLVAEGHQEAAEKFLKESGTTPEVDLASITDRMAVIKAIQCGNVEEAAEKLNALNPEILKTSFLLQQQRLIEIIREGKISEAIAFAKDNLAPFAEESNAYLLEVEDTIALLAFEDHLNCPRKELLDKSQRFNTASEVNAAMFTSQTDEKGPKLDSLLKMLVWTQDQLDEIAVYPRMSDLSTGQLIDPPK